MNRKAEVCRRAIPHPRGGCSASQLPGPHHPAGARQQQHESPCEIPAQGREGSTWERNRDDQSRAGMLFDTPQESRECACKARELVTVAYTNT